MIRRPPRSTRTDTLFPYTTLFRSTVTTFCIVNVPFLGQKIEPPYVSAYILLDGADIALQHLILGIPAERSEEHKSELQSLMRISYAVLCLKKKKKNQSSPDTKTPPQPDIAVKIQA